MIRNPRSTDVEKQSLTQARAMVAAARRAVEESRRLLDHVDDASRGVRTAIRQSRRDLKAAAGDGDAMRGTKKARKRRSREP